MSDEGLHIGMGGARTTPMTVRETLAALLWELIYETDEGPLRLAGEAGQRIAGEWADAAEASPEWQAVVAAVLREHPAPMATLEVTDDDGLLSALHESRVILADVRATAGDVLRLHAETVALIEALTEGGGHE